MFLNATECLLLSVCECFPCVSVFLCVSECLTVFISVPEYC